MRTCIEVEAIGRGPQREQLHGRTQQARHGRLPKGRPDKSSSSLRRDAPLMARCIARMLSIRAAAIV